MRKNIIYFVCIAVMMLAASCQKHVNVNKDRSGYLSFTEFTLDLDETVDTKADPAGGGYSIFVLDAEGVTVRSMPYSDVKNNDDLISLPAGNYTLIARSQMEEVPVAEFDNPVYGVSKDFAIEAGAVTEIGQLTCTLLQCKVTVSYSDEFLTAVTGEGSTTVEIKSGNSLSFALNADKSYDETPGYFAVSGNTMTVVFNGNIEGKSAKMTKTFSNIAPKQWRKIKFVQKKNEQGDATFDIVIADLIGDITLNGDISVNDETIIGEDPSAPKGDGDIRLYPDYTTEDADKNTMTVVYVDGETYDNGDQKIDHITIPITAPVVADVPDMLIKLKALVPGKVKKFTVDILTDNKAFETAVATAGATHLDLISPKEENMIIFDVVPFPYGEALLGKDVIPFDLSKAQPAICGFKGNHTFLMNIADESGCKNTIKVIMVVE